jgi:hypothetical protein
VLHHVMKQPWVSGTERFWSSAQTFSWSEPGCTMPSQASVLNCYTTELTVM